MNKVLYDARTAAGMTQQQLADAVGCIRQHISKIELGENQPSVQIAIKIGRTLGIDWPTLYADLEAECEKNEKTS